MHSTIWDVQHGLAIHILTPGNQHIQIDLGTGSYGSESLEFSPLKHIKRHYNIYQLDGLIITHPHADHLDDISNLAELPPSVLTRPPYLSEKSIREANLTEDKDLIDLYFEFDSGYNAPIPENNPYSCHHNGGVNFAIFEPKTCSESNINNHSIVTVISYAGGKMLVPGDNESPSWNELLAREDFIREIYDTDILIASHHGLESGYSEELFKHIHPLLTIISDGAYGNTTITDRYRRKSKGWPVFSRSKKKNEERWCLSTRKDGDIEIEFYKNSKNETVIGVSID